MAPEASARIVESPRGVVSLRRSRAHVVGVHLGPGPLRAFCACMGPRRARTYLRGDVDFVPAGAEGTWEDTAPSATLVLRFAPPWVAASEGALAPRLQLRDPQLAHLAWALEAELRAGSPSGPRFRDGLLRAFAERLTVRLAEPRAKGERLGLGVRLVDRVIAHVDANLTSELSVEQLAEVAGVGRTRFKEGFASAVGMPVHRFVMTRRLEAARAMLERGDGTPSEIAAATGFAHASHLARWTRRELGLAPSAIARKAGEPRAGEPRAGEPRAGEPRVGEPPAQGRSARES